MTITERNNKLKHFITCLKCEVSGKPCDVNCSTQYDAGNMGEIIENLEAISKALEQESKTGKWVSQDEDDLKISNYRCSNCGYYQDDVTNYCPDCGARMVQESEG